MSTFKSPIAALIDFVETTACGQAQDGSGLCWCPTPSYPAVKRRHHAQCREHRQALEAARKALQSSEPIGLIARRKNGQYIDESFTFPGETVPLVDGNEWIPVYAQQPVLPESVKVYESLLPEDGFTEPVAVIRADDALGMRAEIDRLREQLRVGQELCDVLNARRAPA